MYQPILRIWEEDRGKNGEEKIFEEILTKNFPNFMAKNIILHIQEVWQNTNKLSSRTITQWHIIVKLSIARDGTSWKKGKKNDVQGTGDLLKSSADFSSEKMKTRGSVWHSKFWKKRNQNKTAYREFHIQKSYSSKW